MLLLFMCNSRPHSFIDNTQPFFPIEIVSGNVSFDLAKQLQIGICEIGEIDFRAFI